MRDERQSKSEGRSSKFEVRRWAFFAIALTVLLTECAGRRPARPGIVASTTLISTIIESMAPSRFRVTTIAPAGLCPGHFDLKPSDVTAANNAQLVLSHGWEAWFPALEKAIIPPGPRRVTLATRGNWMVPEVQKQAADEIAALLTEIDPSRADTFRRSTAQYRTRVDSASVRALGLLRGKELPRVLAADRQASFLAWLGFRVVATYGRAEDFTAQELTRLARVAQDSGVGLIVDNLQSGPDAGRPLAEALKVKQVTLTNFPLHGDYIEALLANADTLAKLLK
jgi:zinc transport system substrate-binding protein